MRQILTLTLTGAILVVASCGSEPGRPAGQAPPAPAAPTSPAASSPEPEPVPPSPEVPLLEDGPGTFRIAPGGTGVVGTGQLLRYRVEVEDGIQIDPADFAAIADEILADPTRGWTAGGQWSFQRVDGEADFLLRLASPATVDYICGMYWLDTQGEYSCRAGDYVMINLRRWLHGVPHFADDLATYRNMVINHEVGHRLGHGHVGCPGEGSPAPVMMQQTIALEGCLPNGWPYVDGGFLTGPPRP